MDSDLNTHRDIDATDMANEFVGGTIQEILNCYLTEISEAAVDFCMERLLENNIICRKDNSLIWCGAFSKAPSRWKRSDRIIKDAYATYDLDKNAQMEDAIFRYMSTICKELTNAATAPGGPFEGQKSTTHLVCEPNKTTASEIPGASFKSDSLFYRTESTVPVELHAPGWKNTADVAANCEYKRTVSKRREVMLGMLYGQGTPLIYQ
jgi:hypothetical protein